MPRKKSIKRSVSQFKEEVRDILYFTKEARRYFSKKHVSWVYEYAIIRLYREFEKLILDVLVGAVNNDTSTLSEVTGFTFPKHLTDEVCRFLIIGDGYFDFKGRDSLIRIIRRYVPVSHYIVEIIRKERYKDPLDKLVALRNFSAHASTSAKKRAKKVVGQKRMPDAGSWLKKRRRLEEIANNLVELADEIESRAPY